MYEFVWQVSVWEQKEMLRDTASEEDIVQLREQQMQLHTDYESVKQVSDDRCSTL